ncbi:MAG: hypothetical protein E7Z63_01105 [Thermoplasmata archaeon]|nr:hypothetical protein [Thermoplasmata archaeon]
MFGRNKDRKLKSNGMKVKRHIYDARDFVDYYHNDHGFDTPESYSGVYIPYGSERSPIVKRYVSERDPNVTFGDALKANGFTPNKHGFNLQRISSIDSLKDLNYPELWNVMTFDGDKIYFDTRLNPEGDMHPAEIPLLYHSLDDTCHYNTYERVYVPDLTGVDSQIEVIQEGLLPRPYDIHKLPGSYLNDDRTALRIAEVNDPDSNPDKRRYKVVREYDDLSLFYLQGGEVGAVRPLKRGESVKYEAELKSDPFSRSTITRTYQRKPRQRY